MGATGTTGAPGVVPPVEIATGAMGGVLPLAVATAGAGASPEFDDMFHSGRREGLVQTGTRRRLVDISRVHRRGVLEKRTLW